MPRRPLAGFSPVESGSAPAASPAAAPATASESSGAWRPVPRSPSPSYRDSCEGGRRPAVRVGDSFGLESMNISVISSKCRPAGIHDACTAPQTPDQRRSGSVMSRRWAFLYIINDHVHAGNLS